MKGFFLGILVALIIIVVGYFSFQYGKNNLHPGVISNPQSSESTNPSVSSLETPTPGLSDNELIKAALFKKNSWKESDGITITVSTNDGKYASGTASAQGGGGYFFADKVNSNWEIVANGNGVITCESLVKYPDFPKTLIPECYDQASGKTVKR